jgi:hypothetical protein
MKNKSKLLALSAVVLLTALSLTACGDARGGNSKVDTSTDTSVIYRSADANNSYDLEIIKSGARAAYSPKGGDDYTMTITKMSDGKSKKSDGKVRTASGGKFTLEKDGKSFEVTVANGAMTDITGDIPLNDGTTITPGAVTKIGTFTLTGIPAKYEGWGARFESSDILGFITYDSDDNWILAVISGGKVVIPLWVYSNDDYTYSTRYSGNDTLTDDEGVILENPKNDDDQEYFSFATEANPLKFSDGSAERKWSDGKKVEW